jgi:hypothetical protein
MVVAFASTLILAGQPTLGADDSTAGEPAWIKEDPSSIQDSTASPEDAVTPTKVGEPLRGSVQISRGYMQAQMRAMRTSLKQMEKDTLILVSETHRTYNAPAVSPNAVGSGVGAIVIPGLPTPTGTLPNGHMDPRPSWLETMLSEMNAHVRHIQQNMRKLNAGVEANVTDDVRQEWRQMVDITADIIGQYRLLETLVLRPPYEVPLIDKCTLRINRDIQKLDRPWRDVSAAISRVPKEEPVTKR